jgi:threonine 3-dehydrogenase
MIAPEEELSCRVYNVAAMSFTPAELFNEVKKQVPELTLDYNIDDRQKIGLNFQFFYLRAFY